jgi:hypothetical protein
MRIEIEFIFERNYEIEPIFELSSEERYYFPGSQRNSGHDGMIVKVTPIGKAPWIGIFAFGTIAPNGISAIYSMPNKNTFCIISKGAGYITSATNPEKWEEVIAVPITDARCVESKKIIVFADYTELVAYDENGFKWKTQRLAYDNFKIIGVDKDILKGRFWDIRNEREETFEVNLNDGTQVGGAGNF